MQIGVQVPHRGPMTDPACIQAIVSEGEALGYEVLIVSDHIVVPKDIDSRYPYSEAGDFPGRVGGECMEQLALLAYVAAMTKKAKLLTSVMVVPHREPLLAAKSLATTDQLSGGRLIVGCGTGWMREEFDAIGADFDNRGAVTDDYIRIFKKVWTEEDPQHSSQWSTFSNIAFRPQPLQKPHPPIWIGGESGRAQRRVAELADGWYPLGANPRQPLDTPDRYLAARDQLWKKVEAAGRSPEDITLAYNAPFHFSEEQKNREGTRQFLTGSAQARADDLNALKDIGVSTVVISTAGTTLEKTLDRMREFQENVRPLMS